MWPTQIEYYVSKTLQSDPNHTATDSSSIDGISFYIKNIYKSTGAKSNYKYIRIKLVGSKDTAWLMSSTMGGSYSLLSGKGSSTISFKILKNRYVEALSASVNANTVSAYYYGNDKTKSAIVDIREGVNDSVTTD